MIITEAQRDLIERWIYISKGRLIWESVLPKWIPQSIVDHVLTLAGDYIIERDGEEIIDWPALWKEFDAGVVP